MKDDESIQQTTFYCLSFFYSEILNIYLLNNCYNVIDSLKTPTILDVFIVCFYVCYLDQPSRALLQLWQEFLLLLLLALFNIETKDLICRNQ